MPKPLDPKITEVLKKYGFDRSAIWDCHGTWVVYHKVCEQIAAKAGIVFDMPEVIVADCAAKSAVICVGGKLGDVYEWSFGEAAPYNNKNAYPWAMAEKRAKDRVILKLIGLHGLAYSEEETDDFKPTSAEAKRQDKWGQLQDELADVNDHDALQDLWAHWTEKEYPGLTKAWREQADEAFDKRADELKSANGHDVAAYITAAEKIIGQFKTVEDLESWFVAEESYRKKYALTSAQTSEIIAMCKAKKAQLVMGAG